MIWAIYRLHYGLDFLKQSVSSIINNVDKIFIFYSMNPWVKQDFVKYRNQEIKFPKNPEDIQNFLLNNFKNEKIIIKNYECDTPLNQFGKLYDISCKISSSKPKYVLFMEPDMLFGENQLKNFKNRTRFKILDQCYYS